MRPAVVLAPLAVLLGLALAVQTGTGVPRFEPPVRPIAEKTDFGGPDVSAARVQPLGVVRLHGHPTEGGVPQAAWSLGKSKSTRRVVERWASASLVSLAVLPSRPLVAAGAAPQAFDASSPEYLILRRLRL